MVKANNPPLTSPATPLWWRFALASLVIGLLSFSAFFRSSLPAQVQSLLGFVSLFALAATFSANLRAVNWRTIGVGLLLQVILALFILKFEVAGYRPGQALFEQLGQGISKFLQLSNEGSRVVFGPLVDGGSLEKGLGLHPGEGFIFAFTALPTIIFVSCFFAVLYYLGVLQFIVKLLARAMMFLMGTSGAETLSSAANVFMGQTEAPLIVRPYVKGMTQSELLALMAGGMATVSGGMLAVYASPGIGASPVALLATSVMAAPCGLYLSKLVLPETEEPQTRGTVKIEVEQPYRNVIDAAAGGVTDGLKLALNVGAMLIAFIAMVALVNAILTQIHPDLTLENVFARLFWPLAMAMGVEKQGHLQRRQALGDEALHQRVVRLHPNEEDGTGTTLTIARHLRAQRFCESRLHRHSARRELERWHRSVARTSRAWECEPCLSASWPHF